MGTTARRPGAKQKGAPAKKAAPARKAARGPITQPTRGKVGTFLATLDTATRADCEALDAWMAAATGAGTMYGKAIVGYGTRVIRYADGREAPWLRMGFSPRKQALALYGLLGDGAEALLAKLGPHDTGKGCLYVKRLAEVDQGVLRALIARAAKDR